MDCLSDPPEQFRLVENWPLWLLVRGDLAVALRPLLHQWATETLPLRQPLPGGRGGAVVFEPAPQLRVVVRSGRRGGLVRWLNRDVYFGFQPRPFRELRVTEQLRERGVPAAEVLAAAVRWLVPGCYRGVLVTRVVAGAVNLWEYLQTVGPEERARVCHVAAAATRRLHDAGGVHLDLNLQNYLVRPDTSGGEVLVIDYDRVRLRPVSPHERRAAFARLCRSVRRLDPEASVVTLSCVEALQTIARA